MAQTLYPGIFAIGSSAACVSRSAAASAKWNALANRLIEKEVVDRAALAQLIADTESAPQSGVVEQRA
jgi:hypothetical protein